MTQKMIQLEVAEAKEKFKFIVTKYEDRENLKVFAEKTGILDFKILAHWSRSIIHNNYNLEHPDYLEYKENFNKDNVQWLRKGYTIVNMEKYKEDEYD